jgi:hypothetical protein
MLTSQVVNRHWHEILAGGGECVMSVTIDGAVCIFSICEQCVLCLLHTLMDLPVELSEIGAGM